MQGTPPDQVYREQRDAVGEFRFDSTVATVFDDMVSRSVPFYAEMQRMVVELSRNFARPGTNIYDLGCSSGTTFAALDPVIDRSVRFVGVDSSPDMLGKAREKLAALNRRREVELRAEDINEGCRVENASVVNLILTLQFVRPQWRERLVRDIHRGLNPGGALILVEKVICEEPLLDRLFIEYYYDMKRRHGYSELEISQKRTALENVLIPYTVPDNRDLLLHCGFSAVDVFFKWYNFCGLVALR